MQGAEEIVAILIDGWVTNDPILVYRAISENRPMRLLSRWEMQFMANADLGEKWIRLANSPTLFELRDEDEHPR